MLRSGSFFFLLVLLAFFSLLTGQTLAKEQDCTEYSTKTVKYVHYSTSSIFETAIVTLFGPPRGTATAVVTSYASPVVVTVHASAATTTITEVVLSTSTINGSASVTVTALTTNTGATATTYVTGTVTVGSTKSVIIETISSAGRASPISVVQLALLALAGAAILLIQ